MRRSDYCLKQLFNQKLPKLVGYHTTVVAFDLFVQSDCSLEAVGCKHHSQIAAPSNCFINTAISNHSVFAICHPYFEKASSLANRRSYFAAVFVRSPTKHCFAVVDYRIAVTLVVRNLVRHHISSHD